MKKISSLHKNFSQFIESSMKEGLTNYSMKKNVEELLVTLILPSNFRGLSMINQLNHIQEALTNCSNQFSFVPEKEVQVQ